jgi:hypothetical protein
MHKCIDCILFGKRQPCMLIQPPSVLVWNAITILNVQSDDSDFVHVSELLFEKNKQTGSLV